MVKSQLMDTILPLVNVVEDHRLVFKGLKGECTHQLESSTGRTGNTGGSVAPSLNCCS